MSKVKLTREQAAMIENHRENFEFLMSKRITENCPTRLDNISVEDVARAFIIGYEVKPEFKDRDWLVHWAGEENVIRQAVSNVKGDFIDVEDEEGDTYIWNVKHIRHATPEEIEKEKQRRWWAKHGREVWYLNQGDIIRNGLSGKIKEIEEHQRATQSYALGSWKVICFADDRKDVQA